MATVYEIIQGLSQAAANAYDGALGEDESTTKTGVLRREEGDAIIDYRVMDGFNVKFYGNMMCVAYQSECQLKEVYKNGFESDVEQRIADIAGFLKKEYKKITGKTVGLTPEGEVDIRVESTGRTRTWYTAKMHYKVGGLSPDMNDDNRGSTNPVEAGWKTFLEQGGWGKRPENDSRPKNSGKSEG